MDAKKGVKIWQSTSHNGRSYLYIFLFITGKNDKIGSKENAFDKCKMRFYASWLTVRPFTLHIKVRVF